MKDGAHAAAAFKEKIEPKNVKAKNLWTEKMVRIVLPLNKKKDLKENSKSSSI